MGIIAASAPILHTQDPNAIEPQNRFDPPSAAHWFGTDDLGRDVYSRTIFGGRISMLIAVAVTFFASAGALVFGVGAAYFRGGDMIGMRVIDGLMSIPPILLGMAFMALLGGSLQNVIIAVSITQLPLAARVLRSSVLSLREVPFVDAARAIGASPLRIIVVHILPNTMAPLIVQSSFIAAAAVLLEAYLSFLGAGLPSDVPSWGLVMADAQNYLSRAIWVIIFPGIFLVLTVLGISLVGDALRDILDPRLRPAGQPGLP